MTKFVTRSFRLVGEAQRHGAIALLNNLPVNADEPLEVVFREPPKARGLDANGYYWMRLGEIADQAWLSGRQYDKDCWHRYSGIHLMPEEITTKNGDVFSKWVEMPDGAMKVISTTQLERKCFANYTEIVEAFGAGLGVMFSANRERQSP